MAKLDQQWVASFGAIGTLEEEIGYPLRRALVAAAEALEREDFSTRVGTAKAQLKKGAHAHVD